MPRYSATSKLHATGVYYYRVDGEMRYFPRTVKTQEEALQALQALKEADTLTEREPSTNDSETPLHVLIDHFWTHGVTDKHRRNVKAKEAFLTMFKEEFGTRVLRGLKPYEIEGWINSHGTWGPCHRLNATKHLASCFNWL